MKFLTGLYKEQLSKRETISLAQNLEFGSSFLGFFSYAVTQIVPGVYICPNSGNPRGLE